MIIEELESVSDREHPPVLSNSSQFDIVEDVYNSSSYHQASSAKVDKAATEGSVSRGLECRHDAQWQSCAQEEEGSFATANTYKASEKSIVLGGERDEMRLREDEDCEDVETVGWKGRWLREDVEFP